MKKFINISELARILNLIDEKTKKPLNHILRYWEKEFFQIKPKKINNRRYYSNDQVEIMKMIKFLLKNKQYTISGVKKILNSKTKDLDGTDFYRIKAEYKKNKLKKKSILLLNKIKKIKSITYGKKNTS